jgi:hypothetical protein
LSGAVVAGRPPGRLDRSVDALPFWVLGRRVGEMTLDGSTPGERLRPLDRWRAASDGREPWACAGAGPEGGLSRVLRRRVRTAARGPGCRGHEVTGPKPSISKVSRSWLIHLLLKSAPRRVRPQPLVDRRHTFAGALQVRRCRERAPEVWPATSSNAARPAVSANEATPPFSAVSPVPTRAPTATSSRSTTRATRRRCADPAEHAPGGSAPPAAPARGSLRPSSARPP